MWFVSLPKIGVKSAFPTAKNLKKVKIILGHGQKYSRGGLVLFVELVVHVGRLVGWGWLGVVVGLKNRVQQASLVLLERAIRLIVSLLKR